jgi:hypothetical protein
MDQDVYTGVDGGFLVEPHFAIRDSPALDADHAALSNDIAVSVPVRYSEVSVADSREIRHEFEGSFTPPGLRGPMRQLDPSNSPHASSTNVA